MQEETVKKIIEEFLKKLPVEFDSVEVIQSDIHPIFSIKTKDSGALIGSRGENLQALNHLVKKIVEKNLNEGETLQLMLDVNEYRSRQIEDIKSKAKMLAERARLFKYDVEMSPMNAYERMVVHATFTDDPNIMTESYGDGKFRRVVIKYIDSQTPAPHEDV